MAQTLRRIAIPVLSSSLFAAAAAALTSTPAAAASVAGLNGATVTIRATVNNRVVTAEQGGSQSLIANRTAVGPWEQFTLQVNGNGTVSLRAHANNRIVTAEQAGARPLIANRTAVGPWEQFTVVQNSDGTVALRASANGRYVTAEQAGARALIANRTAVGAWERFTITGPATQSTPAALAAPAAPATPATASVTGQVTLRAHANGRYVSAEQGGTQALIANRPAAGAWEQFTVVSNGDGTVALRASANGRYVTAEQAGSRPLIANRTAVSTWERFTLFRNADGSSALRAKANGRYVTAEQGGTRSLIANRTAVGAWESFDFRATSTGATIVEPNGSMSNAQFIAAAATAAQQTQRDYRVPASITIAQAILESGWGDSALAYYDKNYFGMKCSTVGLFASGCRSHATSECAPTGACFGTTASFRVYPTVTGSFKDHGSLLATSSTYATARLHVSSPNQYAIDLQHAHYATDPAYASKLTAIMVKYNLYQFDLH
jgi:flagellum-specific peptidoglycan hydrolase FlgJ